MAQVRVGLIGCGVIGKHHAQAATTLETVELVAVADRIPARAAASAAEFGVEQIYLEGDDLLDRDDCDLVVLALPACGRTSLALHAFARGKHVLDEKPVAMSAAEVSRMIAARGDLQAACCSSRYRFTQSADALTEFIAGGRLGELRVVRCRAIAPAGKPPAGDPPEWRLKAQLNGGGILMNWGCYDLDYLLGITGWTLQPETVMAQTWSVSDRFRDYVAPGSEAETHLTALIRCAGGATINYERGEFVSAPRENAWALLGSHGSLHLSMTPGSGKEIVFHEGVTGEGVVDEVIWSGDDGSDVLHEGPLADLATAILNGGEPRTTLEKALVVQRISDGIYASAKRGESVAIG